jgi:hypothetical protein
MVLILFFLLLLPQAVVLEGHKALLLAQMEALVVAHGLVDLAEPVTRHLPHRVKAIMAAVQLRVSLRDQVVVAGQVL